MAQLINKVLAKTWAKREKLLGNDVSYQSLSTFLPGSIIHQEIGLLLMSALSMSRDSMIGMSIQGMNSAQHMDLWEESISQVSLNRRSPDDTLCRIADTHRHDSSEDAILGSSLPSNFDIVPSNDMGEYVANEFESITWPCNMWGTFEDQRGFIGGEDTFAAIEDCFFTHTSSGQAYSLGTMQKLSCCCISGLGGMSKRKRQSDTDKPTRKVCCHLRRPGRQFSQAFRTVLQDCSAAWVVGCVHFIPGS